MGQTKWRRSSVTKGTKSPSLPRWQCGPGFSLQSCHPKAGESSQVWSCVLQTETFKRTKFSTSSPSNLRASLHCCYEHDCHLTLLVQEHPSCLKWLLSTRLLLACCIKNISEVEVHARVYCALVNVPLMVARVLLGLGGFSQPINNLLRIWGE